MENNFENKMEELEKIVEELESGKLSLDESVNKFENGIKLSNECNKILENAEKKITILLKEDNKYKENDFNVDNN